MSNPAVKTVNTLDVSHLKVSQILTPHPLATFSTTPLRQVIQTLAEHPVGALPVIDDQRHVVGILSESDLLWQETGITPPPYVLIFDSVIYLQNPGQRDRELHKALGQTVVEVMTPNPITITADYSVGEAARLMHQHRIHHLPVVDREKHLVGLLSQHDIIQVMAQGIGEE